MNIPFIVVSLGKAKKAWLREGKRTECNVCIAGYDNAKSLGNIRFEGEAEILSVVLPKIEITVFL